MARNKNPNGNNSRSGRSKKPRMTFKERKEQDLLAALDEVYSAEEETKAEPRKKAPAKKKPAQTKSKSQGNATVYIDGENTFFQFYDELKRQRVVRYRDDLVKFDLPWLLSQTISLTGESNIRYYGVKLKEESSSPELLKRTQRMIDHKRRWIGFLSSQNVEFIDAGRLVIRDVRAHGAKEPELTFEEKGVDVRMAVDLADDAATGKIKTAVVMSSDTDLLPAIQVAQKHGVRVTYVSHEKRTNDVLIGAADEVATFTSKDIKEAFTRVN